MNKPYVVVLGASVVDIFGFSLSKYRPYNSTPGRVRMSFGGVCRNIAENLARVGMDTKFISVLGDDEKGRSMIEHSQLYGYDMTDSLILEDDSTPTYLAILNEMGEMVSGIADMGSIDKLTTDFIDSKAEIIKGSEYLFLDADSPENLAHILETYQGETHFILDPVSAQKALNIKHLLKYFHTIKPNRYEAEVLLDLEINKDDQLIDAGNRFLEMGIQNVFISLDSEGIFYTNGQTYLKVTALDVNVSNVTGAGDSFVAGLGYGYMEGLDIVDVIKTAMSMSIIAISSDETINPDLSIDLVHETVNKTKWLVKNLND